MEKLLQRHVRSAIEGQVRSVGEIAFDINDGELVVSIRNIDYKRFVPNFDIKVGITAQLQSRVQDMLIISTNIYQFGYVPSGVVERILSSNILLSRIRQVLERWAKSRSDVSAEEIISIGAEGEWLLDLGRLPTGDDAILTDWVTFHKVVVPGDDGYAITVLFSAGQ